MKVVRMFDENGADAAPQTAERHEKPGDMEGTTAQHMRARAARDALETLAMESHCAGDWSLQRKTVQLTVCVVFLFVSQCMDAAHPIPLPTASVDETAETQAICGRRQSFLIGEALGLFASAALPSSGRYPLAPVLVMVLCTVVTVAGFSRGEMEIAALRGAAGFFTALVAALFIAMSIDMADTQGQRTLFLAFLQASIVAGQVSGPWIAVLVTQYGTWAWQYWLAAIFFPCYVVVYGFAARETDEGTVRRDKLRRLSYYHDLGVANVPHGVRPGRALRILSRCMLPFQMVATHHVTVLVGLVVGVALGTSAGVTAALPEILQKRRGFVAWKAALLMTVAAAPALFVPIHVAVRAQSQDHADKDKAVARFAPQRRDWCHKMAGLATLVVGLYTLALTAGAAHWIFPGLGVAAIASGLGLLTLEILSYLAGLYCLSSADGRDDGAPEPASVPRSSDEDASQEVALQQTEVPPNTAGSIHDKRTRDLVQVHLHDGVHPAAAAGIVVALSSGLLAAAGTSIVAPRASQRMGFTLFFATMATACICLGGPLLLVLHRYHERLQQQLHDRLARCSTANQDRRARPKHENGPETTGPGSGSGRGRGRGSSAASAATANTMAAGRLCRRNSATIHWHSWPGELPLLPLSLRPPPAPVAVKSTVTMPK